MPQQIAHASAWNGNNGVGATLLENWVEERAVGDKIIRERANLAHLSKHGHEVRIVNQDLLTDAGGKLVNQYRTTNVESYQGLPRVDSSQNSAGKRRKHLQAELFKLAAY